MLGRRKGLQTLGGKRQKTNAKRAATMARYNLAARYHTWRLDRMVRSTEPLMKRSLAAQDPFEAALLDHTIVRRQIAAKRRLLRAIVATARNHNQAINIGKAKKLVDKARQYAAKTREEIAELKVMDQAITAQLTEWRNELRSQR